MQLNNYTVMHKKRSLVIVPATIAIALLVGCFSNDKKKTAKSDSSAAKVAQPPNDTFRVRPLTDIKYERTAERLKRGEYLATGILECFMCHSERDWKLPGAPPIEGTLGSGKILEEDSTMRLAPPNITPDKETGAGTWTDDMLARAIREGVGRDQELWPSARGNGWNDSYHRGWRRSYGRPRGGHSREATAGSRLWQHV